MFLWRESVWEILRGGWVDEFYPLSISPSEHRKKYFFSHKKTWLSRYFCQIDNVNDKKIIYKSLIFLILYLLRTS
jgi:hypothetical protein